MSVPEKPTGRVETYFAAIAGQNVQIPDNPQGRIEEYLDYIARTGGGGGGGAFWGSIAGTLADQTDLKNALDGKFDASETTITVPTNLFDITASHENYIPGKSSGAKYSEGTTSNNINTTNLIACSPSEKFKLNLTALPSYIRAFYYDSDQVYIAASGDIYLDEDGYAYFQAGTWGYLAYVCVTANFSSDQWNNLFIDDYNHFAPSKEVVIKDLYFSDQNVEMAKDRLEISSDILNGKKWAVAGDSFTAGDFTGATAPTIPSGKYAGQKAVYPYLIGNRCNMAIQDLSLGSRTLALPSGEGSSYNSFVNQYQNVAADADYLTIYLGINDSHQSIPIGTISDVVTSSFYGAWNTILTWFIANRPNLHIGIIVSNGCDNDDYRTATIAIAEKYGIPYIDLNGDERTPCMMRSTNAAIDSAVRNQRTNNWKVSDDNMHPNAACHAFEATFIEDFLRSL